MANESKTTLPAAASTVPATPAAPAAAPSAAPAAQIVPEKSRATPGLTRYKVRALGAGGRNRYVLAAKRETAEAEYRRDQKLPDSDPLAVTELPD